MAERRGVSLDQAVPYWLRLTLCISLHYCTENLC